MVLKVIKSFHFSRHEAGLLRSQDLLLNLSLHLGTEPGDVPVVQLAGVRGGELGEELGVEV